VGSFSPGGLGWRGKEVDVAVMGEDRRRFGWGRRCANRLFGKKGVPPGAPKNNYRLKRKKKKKKKKPNKQKKEKKKNKKEKKKGKKKKTEKRNKKKKKQKKRGGKKGRRHSGGERLIKGRRKKFPKGRRLSEHSQRKL